MADSKRLGKFALTVGITTATVYAANRYLKKQGGAGAAYDQICQKVDETIHWHLLPPALGLLDLVGVRHILRKKNLIDTNTEAAAPPVAPPADGRYRTQRAPDGTYNDLAHPTMGSAGTRFGRNAPLEQTYPEAEEEMLSPSPRVVSLDLMTRHEFQPATTLNLLAAAWLQFMIRDWLSHGKNSKENPWQVWLRESDDWHENPMRILRIPPDRVLPGEEHLPPTYVNTETHWWDASQMYGTSRAFQAKIRSGVDGKLNIGRNNVFHVPTDSLQSQANLAGWWMGSAIFFTLFELEHNAVCDRLKAQYPTWSDDDLFEHARLVIAALMAKIHTVEWTTAILGHPTLQIAMRANWWGVATEKIHKLLGRISDDEVISGIPGGKTDHFGVPYAITEEFIGVYRMHPLIPDDYSFWSAETDDLLKTLTFPEIAGFRTGDAMDTMTMTDMLYSFGIMHPGAITLHNYPRSLQKFERPDGIVIDLAAHDILRSRELGVPRYNQFRRMLHLKPRTTFEELTDNPQWADEMRRVYGGDIERVDLSVGLFAETPPKGFGFSDTAFRIFVLMASRRLNSDRFFTTDFRPEIYTQTGIDWVQNSTFSDLLIRHFPALAPSLRNVKNPFAPWERVRTGAKEAKE